jgi:hypothetical protein
MVKLRTGGHHPQRGDGMTDWHDMRENETPYVDWWNRVDGLLRANARDFTPGVLNPYENTRLTFDQIRRDIRPDAMARESQSKAKDIAYSNFAGGAAVPIPIGSENRYWDPVPDPEIVRVPPDAIDRLPDDVSKGTVIVAVIDTGIALGHRAFRRANGTTRVISAWQQTALFQNQLYLPFGEEIYSGDINARLLDHSRNRNLMDRLDEDGFNRALRLVEPMRIRGHRDLDHRAAHGTHVMDLCAGCDPTSDEAKRIRMIVVNLPTQYLHGSAGNFLEYFAAFAVERVFAIAKALWEKNFPGEDGGFPVALNLAYGMMAGPKDGSMPLESLIAANVHLRGDLPTSVCMPAGNENLARAVARLKIKKNDWSTEIPWRTLPSDRTSNFLEFWFERREGSSDPPYEQYEFKITAPDGTQFHIKNPKDRHFHELADVGARLYCRVQDAESVQGGDVATSKRLYFLLATAPTLSLGGDGAVQLSPAGLWTVRIFSPEATGLEIYVQSDQSGTFHSKAGLRSYFDDEDYVRHMPNGRVLDSFAYPYKGQQSKLEPDDALVTRFGTQNALATTPSNSAFGGHRLSDGRPAPYSATSAGTVAIQGTYPTDDAPAHYGVLASGARDGASVAFRGTSMAAAQATRRAAQAMGDWIDKGRPGSSGPIGDINWHEEFTALQEKARPAYYLDAGDPKKIGKGRARQVREHREKRPDRL